MVQKLSRQQLQSFLPNFEAIKAFEALFDYMAQAAPDNFDEIYSLIGSTRRQNVDATIKRLEDLEALVGRKTSLTDVNARLDALESSLTRSANLGPILRRLENIETFLGI